MSLSTIAMVAHFGDSQKMRKVVGGLVGDIGRNKLGYSSKCDNGIM